MKKIYILLYYIIFKNLPSSFFPLGGVFNNIRVGVLKQIITIGTKCKIQKNVYFGNGSNITIGSFCQINENTKIRNVSIGDYVMIAPGVNIVTGHHNYTDYSQPMMFQEEIQKTTNIGSDVWIGTNAIIMNGVTIGNGCIIGANSVVTKDCETLGVYGGVPAKLIKKRFIDTEKYFLNKTK